MKNILKEILLFTIIFLYFIYILKYNSYITHQTIYSVNIWLNKILPTLFPTFIIVDIIYNTNLPYYIEKYFHINFIYIISILSGSPSNAYVLNKYNQNITKIISVTKYTSPIFTYTFLKAIFDHQTALLLISLNILSNIILKLIIKPKNIKYIPSKKETLYTTITNSIKKNINNLITILGTTIFFNTLPIHLINNQIIKSIILSFLEITSSLNNLTTTTLPYNIKILLTIISLSTCGLCIETQIKSIINDTLINYKQYLIYRLLHTIIFLILGIIILL